MSKTLVVYYSFQGHTKKVAESIAVSKNADIIRIKLKREYNIATAFALARRHVNTKHTPELLPLELDITQYDEIIIGTPVWWYSLTPPIRSFINQYDLSGKNIRLFSTHGGANGSTFEDLKELLRSSNIVSCKDYYSATSLNFKKIQGDYKE